MLKESLRDDGDIRAAMEQTKEDVVEVQSGVRKMERMARQWTRLTLWIAFVSIFILATLTALQGATTSGLITYVSSQFGLSASGVPTINIVSAIMYTAVKPPMAKVADVLGRTEGFLISILLYVLGLIMMAACTNFSTYAAAQIFYVAGVTGLQILIQIFFADTTSLVNRALFITLPNIPYMFTWAAGPSITGELIAQSTDNWRWGYGIFCIIVPVAFLPLGTVLVHAQLKARRAGGGYPDEPLTWNPRGIVRTIYYDLDIVGIILLTAGLACFLLPFSVSGASVAATWSQAYVIVLIIIGPLCLIAWVVWSLRFARHPILNLRLLRDRTVAGGCLAGFFYYMAFYLWDNYFYAWMMVSKNQSFTATGRITQTFDLSSTAATIIAGLLIKYFSRYKYIVLFGAPVYCIGIGLMIAFRSTEASIAQVVVAQCVIGIGAGFFNVPTQAAVQAVCNHQDVAAATALYLTSLPLGGAVGSAIASAIFQTLLPSNLRNDLPGVTDEVVSTATNEYLTVLTTYDWGSPTRSAIAEAYSEVMRILCIAALVVGLLMIPCVLFMRDFRFVDRRSVLDRSTVQVEQGNR